MQLKEIVEDHSQGVKLYYNVYQSTYTNESWGEVIRHQVRHLKNDYVDRSVTDFTPQFVFDSNVWPYDPTICQQYGYFMNDFGPVVVPPEHYFALGDNRDGSLDGRFWGCVPYRAIKGTAMFKIWPPGAIH